MHTLTETKTYVCSDEIGSFSIALVENMVFEFIDLPWVSGVSIMERGNIYAWFIVLYYPANIQIEVGNNF